MTKDEFVTERTRIISKMLDNPDKYGIYPTTKCFNELDALFDKLTSDNSDYAQCPNHDHDLKGSKELIINRLQHLAIEQGLDMDNCKDIAEVYGKHFKSEIEQLYACRAALRDCVEALETAQGYVESSGWTRHRNDEIAQVESAITNARKALGEQ